MTSSKFNYEKEYCILTRLKKGSQIQSDHPYKALSINIMFASPCLSFRIQNCLSKFTLSVKEQAHAM